MTLRNIVYIVVLAAALASCSNGGACRESMDVFAQGEFYNMIYNQTSQQMEPQYISLPVRIKGLGVDSVIVESRVSNIKLPLNKFATTSMFELGVQTVADTDTIYLLDTLSVRYDNRDELVSAECGCLVNHTLVRIEHTNHLLDSIVIVDPTVERQSANNLKIYFNIR